MTRGWYIEKFVTQYFDKMLGQMVETVEPAEPILNPYRRYTAPEIFEMTDPCLKYVQQRALDQRTYQQLTGA